jgi:hypothetical protein
MPSVHLVTLLGVPLVHLMMGFGMTVVHLLMFVFVLPMEVDQARVITLGDFSMLLLMAFVNRPMFLPMKPMEVPAFLFMPLVHGLALDRVTPTGAFGVRPLATFRGGFVAFGGLLNALLVPRFLFLRFPFIEAFHASGLLLPFGLLLLFFCHNHNS